MERWPKYAAPPLPEYQLVGRAYMVNAQKARQAESISHNTTHATVWLWEERNMATIQLKMVSCYQTLVLLLYIHLEIVLRRYRYVPTYDAAHFGTHVFVGGTRETCAEQARYAW